MTDTIEQLLRRGRERLDGGDSPRLDAEILLAHVLGKPRSWLVAWPERCPDAPQQARYEALITRRAAGEPVAYLTGEREFWSLSLEVTPATLVPRPDTELLVEHALNLVADLDRPRIADLGTGSGAIALALATERPDATIVATDASAEALAVASRNAERLGVTNVRFRLGHWLAALAAEPFDLIVSNPPYVEPGDPVMDRGDLAHEPRTALEGRGDGLDDSRDIAAGAMNHLVPGGWLLLEHGDTQADAVAALLGDTGFRFMRTWPDLAGRPRVTGGQRPAQTAGD